MDLLGASRGSLGFLGASWNILGQQQQQQQQKQRREMFRLTPMAELSYIISGLEVFDALWFIFFLFFLLGSFAFETEEEESSSDDEGWQW